jgi:hypothetical protein
MPSSKKYNKSKGKARKNAAAAATTASSSLVVKNSSGLRKILNHRLSPKQLRRASQMFAKMFNKCNLEELSSAHDALMFGNADEDDAFLEIHFLTMFLFLSNNADDIRRCSRSRFNLWLWEDGQKDVVHYSFTRQRNFGWFCIVHVIMSVLMNDMESRD